MRVFLQVVYSRSEHLMKKTHHRWVTQHCDMLLLWKPITLIDLMIGYICLYRRLIWCFYCVCRLSKRCCMLLRTRPRLSKVLHACTHSHATSCFFHLLQSYLSVLLLSCFVLETVVLSCRCKTTRVTRLYLCHS